MKNLAPNNHHHYCITTWLMAQLLLIRFKGFPLLFQKWTPAIFLNYLQRKCFWKRNFLLKNIIRGWHGGCIILICLHNFSIICLPWNFILKCGSCNIVWNLIVRLMSLAGSWRGISKLVRRNGIEKNSYHNVGHIHFVLFTQRAICNNLW